MRSERGYLYNTTQFKYGAAHNNVKTNEPEEHISYFEFVPDHDKDEQTRGSYKDLDALEKELQDIAKSVYIDTTCWALEAQVVFKRKDEDQVDKLADHMNDKGYKCRFH